MIEVWTVTPGDAMPEMMSVEMRLGDDINHVALALASVVVDRGWTKFYRPSDNVPAEYEVSFATDPKTGITIRGIRALTSYADPQPLTPVCRFDIWGEP